MNVLSLITPWLDINCQITMKYDTGQKKTKLFHELNTAHDLHCATGVGIIHMIHPSGEKKTKTYCQSGRTCIASGDLVKFEACYLWTTYITICGMSMTSCGLVPSVVTWKSTQTEGGESFPKDCSTHVQGAHWISDSWSSDHGEITCSCALIDAPLGFAP